MQEVWDKYDEAYSDIGTFEDQAAADTKRDDLDYKVSDLLARVDTFLEPAQRQETPESDAYDGMAATATKCGAKAAAQNTSIESKIAIMERELDRDDATGQDILKYEQRMSAIENLLDGNLSEGRPESPMHTRSAGLYYVFRLDWEISSFDVYW